MKIRLGTIFLTVVLLLDGCATTVHRKQENASPGALAGIWELCLDLEQAGMDPPDVEIATGYISLRGVDAGSRSWILLGEPTHYGIYTVDLTRLGIPRDPRIPLPLIGARTAGDSLYMVLDPFGSHGPVTLLGRVRSDTVKGSWFHHAYAMGARGTFAMRRIAEHSLPVPYPIDGPLAAPRIAGCP